MSSKMSVVDVRTLESAVVYVDGLEATLSTEALLSARRQITRRAKDLGLLAFIPESWTSAPMTVKHEEPTQTPSNEAVLSAKAETFGVDISTVRRAYIDGIREFSLMPAAERPPLSRDEFALAHVNAVVRSHWHESAVA